MHFYLNCSWHNVAMCSAYIRSPCQNFELKKKVKEALYNMKEGSAPCSLTFANSQWRRYAALACFAGSLLFALTLARMKIIINSF